MKPLFGKEKPDLVNEPYQFVLNPDGETFIVQKANNGNFYFYVTDDEGEWQGISKLSLETHHRCFKDAFEKVSTSLDKFEKAGYYFFSFRHADKAYYSSKTAGLYFLYLQTYDGSYACDFDTELHIDVPIEEAINQELLNKRLAKDVGVIVVTESEVYEYNTEWFNVIKELKIKANVFADDLEKFIEDSFEKNLDKRWVKVVETENGFQMYGLLLSLLIITDIINKRQYDFAIYNHSILPYMIEANIAFPKIYEQAIEQSKSVTGALGALFGHEMAMSLIGFVYLKTTYMLYKQLPSGDNIFPIIL